MTKLILAVIILVPLSIISLTFSGALKLLGATYSHPGNLILFFVIYLVIDFFIDSIFHLLTKKDSILLMFCQNVISLMITDYFVASVSLPVQTIMLFSIFLILFEKSLDYMEKNS